MTGETENKTKKWKETRHKIAIGKFWRLFAYRYMYIIARSFYGNLYISRFQLFTKEIERDRVLKWLWSFNLYLTA